MRIPSFPPLLANLSWEWWTSQRKATSMSVRLCAATTGSMSLRASNVASLKYRWLSSEERDGTVG